MFIQAKDILVAFTLVVAAGLSFYTKKLTRLAAITGFFCAMIIYLGAGYTGLVLLAVFFISGTAATSWGRKLKQKLERNGEDSRRKYGQVLANGGAATLMALLILIFPAHTSLFTIMLAATLASATADTLSSELGMIYGKKFYNCITFKKDIPGLDGVISLEGTFIGIAGAAIIAAIYVSGYSSTLKNQNIFFLSTIAWHFLIIILAGITGNFADSVMGATLERKNQLNNDWVNFLSTMIAGIAACLFYVSFLLF